MDMWNAPMVQSRQPLTYRLMESLGLGERDCREWKLLAVDPHDRHTWKSAMRAASQLPGSGAH